MGFRGKIQINPCGGKMGWYSGRGGALKPDVPKIKSQVQSHLPAVYLGYGLYFSGAHFFLCKVGITAMCPGLW